jgi:hypothetical protein
VFDNEHFWNSRCREDGLQSSSKSERLESGRKSLISGAYVTHPYDSNAGARKQLKNFAFPSVFRTRTILRRIYTRQRDGI